MLMDLQTKILENELRKSQEVDITSAMKTAFQADILVLNETKNDDLFD